MKNYVGNVHGRREIEDLRVYISPTSIVWAIGVGIEELPVGRRSTERSCCSGLGAHLEPGSFGDFALRVYSFTDVC